MHGNIYVNQYYISNMHSYILLFNNTYLYEHIKLLYLINVLLTHHKKWWCFTELIN